MNSVDEIVKLVKDKGFDGVKLVDHAAIREAGPLVFDKESLAKQGKKTLVLALEDAFKHLYSFTGTRQAKERHVENFEDTNTELANLRYDIPGLAHINEDKSFAFISSKNEITPSKLEMLSESFKSIAQELHEKVGVDFEAICVDKHNLANLKARKIPSDVWHDIGLSSLKRLPKGFTEITTILPDFINDTERKQAEHIITHVQEQSDITELGRIITKLENQKYLEVEDINNLQQKDFLPNEILFLNLHGKEHNLRFDPRQERFINFNYETKLDELFISKKPGFHGIVPLNKFQKAQFELLLNTDATYIYGAAGTGKSLLPLALGVHCLTENIRYQKEKNKEKDKKQREIFMRQFFSNYKSELAIPRYDDTKLLDSLKVIRPTVATGEDLGFLPGTMKAKMAEHGAAVYDNLDLILASGTRNKERDTDVSDKFLETGKIEVQPSTYLRGRTVRGYNIVDEAQNFPRSVLTTAMTRVADDAKIVLTGDPSQTDIPDQEIYYNALTRLLNEKAKNPVKEQGILYLPNYMNVRGVISRQNL